MRPIAALALLLALAVIHAGAQQPRVDDHDLQSWNDLQFSRPLNKKTDALFGVTVRIGRNIGRFNEGRAMAGVVHRFNKAFSVQPFYLYIQARNSAGRFRAEHRLHLRGTVHFPVKGFGLAHRSQIEVRIREPNNTWRYRPSITFERDLPERWIKGAKIFITEEPFYDSASGKFSRNRISGGLTRKLNEKLTVDIYYLRQDDRRARPGYLNVLGTSWKIKL
jgi:hypothetical protein